MKLNDAFLERQAIALFNFLRMKRENEKRIGEICFGDLIEIVKFLDELKSEMKGM